jgi:hypothetical protein
MDLLTDERLVGFTEQRILRTAQEFGSVAAWWRSSGGRLKQLGTMIDERVQSTLWGGGLTVLTQTTARR